MSEFRETLNTIANELLEGNGEPMDGDQTQAIADEFLEVLNELNGNTNSKPKLEY